MKTYRTIQGDTWDIIAYHVYETQGREKRLDALLESNPEYREYVIFPAGIILEIPEIDNTISESLPPWKR
ncbi:MAG: tail protein X [Synergistaceae bacterium]|nr:tail protein X [Synergistaceae bacterium]